MIWVPTRTRGTTYVLGSKEAEECRGARQTRQTCGEFGLSESYGRRVALPAACICVRVPARGDQLLEAHRHGCQRICDSDADTKTAALKPRLCKATAIGRCAAVVASESVFSRVYSGLRLIAPTVTEQGGSKSRNKSYAVIARLGKNGPGVRNPPRVRTSDDPGGP
jgi:hypothetical protein